MHLPAIYTQERLRGRGHDGRVYDLGVINDNRGWVVQCLHAIPILWRDDTHKCPYLNYDDVVRTCTVLQCTENVLKHYCIIEI